MIPIEIHCSIHDVTIQAFQWKLRNRHPLALFLHLMIKEQRLKLQNIRRNP